MQDGPRHPGLAALGAAALAQAAAISDADPAVAEAALVALRLGADAWVAAGADRSLAQAGEDQLVAWIASLPPGGLHAPTVWSVLVADRRYADADPTDAASEGDRRISERIAATVLAGTPAEAPGIGRFAAVPGYVSVRASRWLLDRLNGIANAPPPGSDAAALAALVERLLEHERATLPGLGRLVVATQRERTGANPRTGEAIVIPARQGVVLRPAASLIAALRAARARRAAVDAMQAGTVRADDGATRCASPANAPANAPAKE